MGMIAHAWWIVVGVQLVLPVAVAEDELELQVDEKVTPWGTVVDRVSYYLKDGKKVKGSKRTVKVEWRDWKPGSLPDHGLFCRWSWSQFMRRGDYPYLNTMPSYRDVPFLIGRCAKKEEHYQVDWEQLMALTRVSFGNPWLQKDEERKVGSDHWREWWKDVGRHRPELRRKRGVRDQAAWDMVRGGRDLPVPKLAVVIPETYALTANFSSGDYGGVTSETLTIKRSQGEAELVRSFSTLRDGPVTEERWLPFGPEEADRVVRAIGTWSTNRGC